MRPNHPLDKTMNAKDLLEECEKKVPWIDIKIAWSSFTGEFKDLRKEIPFQYLDKDKIDKFIEVCDNRIDRAKDFLSDIVTMLGIFVATVAIVGSILASYNGKEPINGEISKPIKPIYGIWEKTDILFQIFTILIIVGICLLFILGVHYRAQRHAWSAFKEGAVLL